MELCQHELMLHLKQRPDNNFIACWGGRQAPVVSPKIVKISWKQHAKRSSLDPSFVTWVRDESKGFREFLEYIFEI